MYVVKASGQKEEFNPEKIRRTILRSGVGDEVANQIIRKVEKRLYDGIKTREVFDMVLEFLKEEAPRLATLYDLKGAIMRLGPAGFSFETYISEILREYGYSTQVRQQVKGKCALHELDIVFSKMEGNKVFHYFAECKYRNSPGLYVDLKEALYTYARWIDINESYRMGKGIYFEKAWLICNTRASSEAQKYSACVGMKILCWRYPRKKGLERLIEKKKLYPITILRSINPDAQQKLANAQFMLVKDLVSQSLEFISEQSGISCEELTEIVAEAREILKERRLV